MEGTCIVDEFLFLLEVKFFQFDEFVQNNNMTSPSKVREPKAYSMGDDLCEYLTKVGVPKAKVPPNKNFPKGIQVFTMHMIFICPGSVPGSY